MTECIVKQYINIFLWPDSSAFGSTTIAPIALTFTKPLEDAGTVLDDRQTALHRDKREICPSRKGTQTSPSAFR